jgi:DNA-binding LytR/AlgR family response regulator
MRSRTWRWNGPNDSWGIKRLLKEIRNVLSIQYKHSRYSIPYEDIYFIERLNRKCVIHTRDQQYQTYDTLENIKKSLDSSFYQCHRSFIVHAKKIHRISTMGSNFVAHFQHYEHIAYIAKQHVSGLLKAIEGSAVRSG